MAPSLGVVTAIINDDHVLLTKRRDLPVWCLPGGRVEEGESFAQAAIRETQEETGLEITLTRLVGVYSRPIWGAGDHNILFAARAIGGTLQKVTDETVDAKYFQKDNLPRDLLGWFRQRIVDALEEGSAVARTQIVEWPFDLHSRTESYARIESGELDLQEVVQQLCQVPPSENEILDVR